MATARRLLPLALIALLAAPSVPALAVDPVRNPGEPSYRVRLASGPAGRVWRGTERITFTNLDADPLSLIYLRLWSNGVRGCRAGAIVVADVEGGTAGELSERCTVLPIELDAPVAAGGRATVALRLSIELPRRNDRFGRYHGLSLVGTALPTLAIHDDAGWHLPPFVDLGESFYSIVGDYTVTLSVPRGLDTPATGVAVAETGTPDRRVTTYLAEDVRDFAWAAGRLAHLRARSGATSVVVWYQREGLRPSRAAAALRNARRSLDAFSDAFGTFPYPEMDVVLTAFATFGGMEYPTIIFTNPDRLTVAHEIAHQWWYGIVGDDEYTEPWLDESFATWSMYYPFAGWRRCSDGPTFPSDTARTTNDMGYWRAHMDEYGVVYGGGGCLLADLASRLGYRRFVEVLGDYAREHWLGVARTADFTAAVEAAMAAEGVTFDAEAYWSAWRVDRRG